MSSSLGQTFFSTILPPSTMENLLPFTYVDFSLPPTADVGLRNDVSSISSLPGDLMNSSATFCAEVFPVAGNITRLITHQGALPFRRVCS
ncbi:hypothetical protein CEXT_440181 [Caerostris extrusa]|uniref:Uncharacterized protein n=1 Tax=Caerostris extrusa TaxID=172846 RepID=A0AAV4XDQ7_CAEEX|nr:hypothetical protein CEXT_440181 [Caerostris extrusa]